MATLQELRILHTSDRVAYSRLINSLGLDPRTSTQVMAFWNWVKRCGHRDFVHKILPLQDIELQTLVKETIRCIRSLYMDLPMNPFVSIDLQPPFMQSILGSDFSERFIQENRDSAMRTMFMFIKDVAEKIFHDLVIVAPLLPQRLAQTRSTQMVTLNLLAQEARSGPPAQTQSTTQIKNRSLSAQAEANVIPRLPPRSPSSDLSQKERILFMTFSKGHPILKEELNEFITREFGDCVETIYVKEEEEPLFARVLVKSAEVITKILGSKKVATFSINGKEVRVRRFLSKRH